MCIQEASGNQPVELGTIHGWHVSRRRAAAGAAGPGGRITGRRSPPARVAVALMTSYGQFNGLEESDSDTVLLRYCGIGRWAQLAIRNSPRVSRACRASQLPGKLVASPAQYRTPAAPTAVLTPGTPVRDDGDGPKPHWAESLTECDSEAAGHGRFPCRARPGGARGLPDFRRPTTVRQSRHRTGAGPGR